MRFLFILAAFISSSLLFMVEPMAAKIILPTFGGAPAVWNTSLLFFQSVLLLGYGYAHLGTIKLSRKVQAIAHLVLFALAAIALPISAHSAWFNTVRSWAAADKPPVPLIFLALAGIIGLPFLALSANSSTLQRWYASTNRPDSKEPWFLYAAGNVGSMLALLAYPSLIEPRLTLGQQGLIWTGGYGLLLLLLAGCAWFGTRSAVEEVPVLVPETEVGLPGVTEEEAVEVPKAPTAKDRWTWLALSAVPSSLLLGVTTYLTGNIAPIPLLWVVPLALYLLTFILVFAKKPIAPAIALGRIYPLLLTPLIVVLILEASSPALAIFHLAVFFIAAWMCHSRLASQKPDARYLTEFFFFVSLGGVVGGTFNALIAPVAFNTLAEYPVALVAAALLIPKPKEFRSRLILDIGYPVGFAAIMIAVVVWTKSSGMGLTPLHTFLTIGLPAILCFIAVDGPIRFGLSLAACFLIASGFQVSSDGSVVLSERSFFGVHRIIVKNNGKLHELTNGNTTHGIENFDHVDMPLTYYYQNGPIGDVMTRLQPQTAAFVGLGVGSLAAYGHPGQEFTYYEIDPIVKQIATDPKWFTFLQDSKAKVSIKLGDARLELANTQEKYDLIVLDAFSSDAIPVHLLTKEAIQMYLRHLKPNGLLAFHLSNRYLDLLPILAAARRDLGLIGYSMDDGASAGEEALGKKQSEWALLAPNQEAFAKIKVNWWSELEPTRIRAWTDDYSNVLGAFKRED